MSPIPQTFLTSQIYIYIVDCGNAEQNFVFFRNKVYNYAILNENY